MERQEKPRVLALFSGGLDSILAAKLLREQGLHVDCLHFVTPFFGNPGRIPYWSRSCDLDIRAVDVSGDFVRMLLRGPEHGFGSVMNPCVDCKILMLRRARELMEESRACCIATGEVVGQRPMSQRRDTLNIIQRDAGLKDRLLRPLCALHMTPTLAEEAGLVDRSRLLNIAGRGRRGQMDLAKRFGITDIPTPGGGCRLTEQENVRSYWPVLRHTPSPVAEDFSLANTGRQFWHGLDGEGPLLRLIVGRTKDDNARLMELAGERDVLFKTRDFPGPLTLGRFFGEPWPAEAVASAAALTASYSAKAARQAEAGSLVAVRVHTGSLDAPGSVIEVAPERGPTFGWREPGWEEAKDCIRTYAGRDG